MTQPSPSPKICLTASGCLIHQGKVLLVKHKKFGWWLCPGGHIEVDEPPHKAAEREFWEETAVKVRALPHGVQGKFHDSQQLSSPFSSNLHWVSRDNYQARRENPRHYQVSSNWSRGCEQHLNLLYLVEPIGSLDFRENQEETDGIAWFTMDEVSQLETGEEVINEIKTAFTLV